MLVKEIPNHSPSQGRTVKINHKILVNEDEANFLPRDTLTGREKHV